jgi:stearoyl-CoA desaturase (delta-9 desaturase)
VTAVQQEPESVTRRRPEPMLSGEKSTTQTVLVMLFVVIPLLALVAAVPVA